jgi:fibronectin type 3 domain-containing protein
MPHVLMRAAVLFANLALLLTLGPRIAQAELPSVPTSLTATTGDARIKLNWTAAGGASSYDVYRSTISGGEGNSPYAANITATGYTDTSVANGATC